MEGAHAEERDLSVMRSSRKQEGLNDQGRTQRMPRTTLSVKTFLFNSAGNHIPREKHSAGCAFLTYYFKADYSPQMETKSLTF